ncbi:hypothetical protein [Alistipes timonensis]|uniref:hypothetical protein n=1 Tax=Alistipes timonensis TaxID=1465754 RepID=UPI001C3DB79D|nr:hypothetical protein [Alistipes timonensis]MCR2031925.1 hypothetical protein [Alistipes timonensis]
MKRNILKLFAIVAAFFVGVSINNSCGESKMETETHGTGNGSSGSDDEIPIDGLYFNRNGYVSSKPIKTTYFDSNGKTTLEFIYVYDNQGRVQQYTYQSLDMKQVNTYKYSGKKIIETQTVTINNNPNTTQIVTEYY